jgi:hypothetical protein
MFRHRDETVPPLHDVVVLGLAATRIARAISLDEISEPARARLATWADAPAGSPLRRWVNRLVECPICVGWWTSIALSLIVPGRQRLLRGGAVAGAQVLLALLERLVSEEGRAAIHEADQAEAQVAGL